MRLEKLLGFTGLGSHKEAMVSARSKGSFGDFQTPVELAQETCSLLVQMGIAPRSILEPTCGKGNFLVTALENFQKVGSALGLEINEDYAWLARQAVAPFSSTVDISIANDDFFTTDWKPIIKDLPDPLLVIGNPPWVTNAETKRRGGANTPRKSNFQNHRGIDAITGKANFDISEWMLIETLEWLKGRDAILAVLCKTATARKVLLHAWKNNHCLGSSRIYALDAQKYFGVAVDACLLVVVASDSIECTVCEVYEDFSCELPSGAFGYRDGRLVADVSTYERWKHLEGKEWYKWRSGIKHDCSKVMELREEGEMFRNGFGQLIDLEDDYLFPMLKGSHVANRRSVNVPLRMLVTQRTVGEDTSSIGERAPKTWEYLMSHADLLKRRASSIYRNRPQFSMFGVGEYSFAPWKVAISGLYKKLSFEVIGPLEEKPVVFDDTIYFVACQTKEEAEHVAGLLNSRTAKDFFSAFIFWDAKRPITSEILGRLDLLALEQHLGQEERLVYYSQMDSQPSLRLN